MAFGIQHVHIKSADPKQTAQFYIDNLGGTMVAEIAGRGFRVNLHGLTLNITTVIAAQKRHQLIGIEHIAVETDDYAGTLAQMRNERRGNPRGNAAGAKRPPRRLCPGPGRRAGRGPREGLEVLETRPRKERAAWR